MRFFVIFTAIIFSMALQAAQPPNQRCLELTKELELMGTDFQDGSIGSLLKAASTVPGLQKLLGYTFMHPRDGSALFENRYLTKNKFETKLAPAVYRAFKDLIEFLKSNPIQISFNDIDHTTIHLVVPQVMAKNQLARIYDLRIDNENHLGAVFHLFVAYLKKHFSRVVFESGDHIEVDDAILALQSQLDRVSSAPKDGRFTGSILSWIVGITAYHRDSSLPQLLRYLQEMNIVLRFDEILRQQPNSYTFQFAPEHLMVEGQSLSPSFDFSIANERKVVAVVEIKEVQSMRQPSDLIPAIRSAVEKLSKAGGDRITEFPDGPKMGVPLREVNGTKILVLQVPWNWEKPTEWKSGQYGIMRSPDGDLAFTTHADEKKQVRVRKNTFDEIANQLDHSLGNHSGIDFVVLIDPQGKWIVTFSNIGKRHTPDGPMMAFYDSINPGENLIYQWMPLFGTPKINIGPDHFEFDVPEQPAF